MGVKTPALEAPPILTFPHQGEGLPSKNRLCLPRPQPAGAGPSQRPTAAASTCISTDSAIRRAYRSRRTLAYSLMFPK